MTLHKEVSRQGLRASFVKALANKNITELYEWQSAALREAASFQGQNFIYQVRAVSFASCHLMYCGFCCKHVWLTTVVEWSCFCISMHLEATA